MDFRVEFERVRLSRGWTKGQLARNAKRFNASITASAVSEFLAGTRDLESGYLSAISRAYGGSSLSRVVWWNQHNLKLSTAQLTRAARKTCPALRPFQLEQFFRGERNLGLRAMNALVGALMMIAAEQGTQVEVQVDGKSISPSPGQALAQIADVARERGRSLQRARKKAGLSRRILAKLVGLTAGDIDRAESGYDDSQYPKLAAALGLKIA